MSKSAFWRLLPLLAAGALLTSCASYILNVPTSEPSPGKSTPVITWASPAPILEGAPLSSAQLNATANAIGTFAYTPAAGTVFSPGTQTLSVTFTPLDTAEYNTATASVSILVTGDSGPGIKNTSIAVADGMDGRVLIFNAPLKTGMSADIVLGQPDFTTSSPTQPGPNTLNYPVGLSIDAAGNLYVADARDARVLRFSPPFANGMNASLVLGQASLTANVNCFRGPAITPCAPYGVTVDPQGNVWVADSGGGRLLEYVAPIETGMDPTVVLGHSDMTQTTNCDGINDFGGPGASTDTTDASHLCAPGPIRFDSDGNLWVVDGNGRILEFTPPFSNGMSASIEIGYPASVGMNSPTPWAQGHQCPTATSAISPIYCGFGGLAFDAHGNLWTSGFGVILEFTPPFTSGMSPSLVIGTYRGSNAWVPPTAKVWNGTPALAFDSSGDLIVSDYNDSRILIFVPPFTADMSASIVLGQPDMNTDASSACQPAGAILASNLCEPTDVLVF